METIRSLGATQGEAPVVAFVVNADWVFLDYRISLAREMRRQGWQVHVLTGETGRGEAIAAEGFDYHPLPLSREGMNPLAELRALHVLRSRLRALRPDVVHNLTIKPVLYGSLATPETGRAAVVNSICGLGYMFTDAPRARMIRPIVKGLYRRALARGRGWTIFENHDDLAEFTAHGLVPSERCQVVPGLGVDCDRFRPAPVPDGPPVVLLPARMLRSKGLGEFVEAARQLTDRGTSGRFVLAGAPDPSNPDSVPEAQLRKWHDGGVVEWWGRQDDMPAVYQSAAIVVLPTRYREGVPRALLEGAASGRPLIGTDMPGCREVVRDGETGFVVHPGDAGALADALQRLLSSAELRAHFGAAARALALQKFEAADVMNRLVAIHEGLLRPGVLPLRRGRTPVIEPGRQSGNIAGEA